MLRSLFGFTTEKEEERDVANAEPTTESKISDLQENLQYAGRSMQAFHEALTELKDENERLSKELSSLRDACDKSQAETCTMQKEMDEMTTKTKALEAHVLQTMSSSTDISVRSQVRAILRTENIPYPATQTDWEELSEAFMACSSKKLCELFPMAEEIHCEHCSAFPKSTFNLMGHVICQEHKKKAAASTSSDAIRFWINVCKDAKLEAHYDQIISSSTDKKEENSDVLAILKTVPQPATEADWRELADAFKICTRSKLNKLTHMVESWRCEQCSVESDSISNVIQHVVTKSHTKKAGTSTSLETVVFWINACKEAM